MSLKSATLLALVGMILATILLAFDLVASITGVMGGVVPPAVLLRSLIYAFASLGLTVFLYVFQKRVVKAGWRGSVTFPSQHGKCHPADGNGTTSAIRPSEAIR